MLYILPPGPFFERTRDCQPYPKNCPAKIGPKGSKEAYTRQYFASGGGLNGSLTRNPLYSSHKLPFGFLPNTALLIPRRLLLPAHQHFHHAIKIINRCVLNHNFPFAF